MLAAAAPLAAQQPEFVPPDTARALALDTLDVTVVRGVRPLGRVPAAVATVGQAAIRAGQPTLSLEESLRRVPGVVVDHRHNYSIGDRIAIRGFGTRAAFGVRGVRVLVDGIPLTTPDGQTNLNNLDLGSTGRIDVIRGPASSLYGNAAGGVIAVVTEDAPAAALALHGRTVIGDYGGGSFGDLAKAQVKLGGRVARWDYVASIAHTDADGYREHARVRQTVLNSRVRIAFGAAASLAAVLNAADVPVAQNPGALPLDSARMRPRMAWPANINTGAGSATRQVQAGLIYRRVYGRARLESVLHGAWRDLANPLPFGVIGLRRHAGGARTTFVAWLGDGHPVATLTAGFDVEGQSDARTEHNNVGGRAGDILRRDQVDRVGAIGPFAELTLPFARRAEFTIGARYDRIHFSTTDRFLDDGRDDSGTRTLTALSPLLALHVEAGRGISAFANLSTSFQTPTTTELINAPPESGETCCPGGFNAALEPQRAVNAELGVRVQLGTELYAEATAYAMRIRDALVPFQVPDVVGREFFRNAGRSRQRGVELLGSWDPRHDVGLHVAYAYSDFRYIDAALPAGSFAGNRYPGVAPHRLTAGLAAPLPPGMRAALDLVHTSRFFVTDDNAEDAVSPAATVVHLRLESRTGLGRVALRPFIGVQNLFDTRYNSAIVVNAAGGRYYEPAPARNVHFGFSAASAGWSR